MGMIIEFNPDLALRSFSEHKIGKRRKEECFPEKMEIGATYEFLKNGFRTYYFEGEIPLVETKGNEELSHPKASILIIEATHFLSNGSPCTKGKYKVTQIFDPKDKNPHFEGFQKIK